jgi:hypothetical protein
MTDGEKEKIKLRAAFANGLAIGIMLIGAFTPITRAAYDPSVPNNALALMALMAVVCFALGAVLHLLATRHLNGLDQ